MKKYFTDPSFLFLLAANAYCIWYYQFAEDGFATVVWIYWFQSIIIGLFNFLDLLRVKHFEPGSLKMNDEPVTAANKGCVPFFFALHYGLFHFVYAIFLLVQFGVSAINGTYVLLGVAGFILEGIIAFIRRERMRQYFKVNLGAMLFLPYLRIVLMHLMILGPAFLGWKESTIFLVLKMIADILTFILYQYIFTRKRVQV